MRTRIFPPIVLAFSLCGVFPAFASLTLEQEEAKTPLSSSSPHASQNQEKTPFEIYYEGILYEENGQFKEAWAAYHKAALQKYVRSYAKLKVLYDKKQGIFSNSAQAYKGVKEHADASDPIINTICGWFYRDGLECQHDVKHAFQLFQLASNQGYACASFDLGLFYEEGRGTAIDLKKAFLLYKEASTQDYVFAHYNLGSCYEHGKGIEPNLTKAALCYKRAADSGLIQAQFTIAEWYRQGIGLSQDNDQAAFYYKKAAKGGHAEAQYNYGLILEHKGDKQKALRWHHKAYTQGYVPAINKYWQLVHAEDKLWKEFRDGYLSLLDDYSSLMQEKQASTMAYINEIVDSIVRESVFLGERKRLEAEIKKYRAFIEGVRNGVTVFENPQASQHSSTGHPLQRSSPPPAISHTLTERDDDGKALAHAIDRGNIKAIQTFLEAGHEVDWQDHKGRSLLERTCYQGSLKLCQFLLDNGANPDHQDNQGNTPLYMASSAGHRDIVKALLNVNAAVNTADERGVTALHIAVKKGHADIVALLCEKGANVNASTSDGQTPLSLAQRYGHGAIGACLKSYGAKKND